MPSLKSCPCGSIPTDILVEDGVTHRWKMVSGNCCGAWKIEVRSPYGPSTDWDHYRSAWNKEPRGRMESI